MNSKTILVLSLIAAGFSPVARADVDVDISAEIRIGRALPPPPPEVVVVERVGPPGPPPWAKTRWYRRGHDYYYYPGCDVYYRPADRIWYYREGGIWRNGSRLPTTIRVDFGHAVSLRIEDDRPYVYHDKVVVYYPANYFTRVKVVPSHDRRDHRDRNGHGRDKRH